jgi:glycosyltransferase involved in cell wall biosynthesis
MKTVVYDHQIFNLQKFGGISRYFCEIASRIQKEAGWRSRVVAPVHCNKYLAESDVPTRGIYLPSSRMEDLRATVNKWASPIFSTLKSGDILHQTYYSNTRTVSRARLVVTVCDMIHELSPQYFPATDQTAQYKRETIEAADHVVCISHQTANDMTAILKVPHEKITVTHLGFSPIFNNSEPIDTRSSNIDRPYLLYVGHRTGYKNFSKVLEAFASSKILSDELDLVAFGGNRFTQDELTSINELRLRPDSIRHQSGNDATLARIYKQARAFVYPSEYEGFGIPPLEAMASGCAVACSNTSVMPEVVGNAGEYFDPRQVESVRAALETLAFNDSRRNELIDAGRLRCRLFSWSKCAEETLHAYEKALSASRN